MFTFRKIDDGTEYNLAIGNRYIKITNPTIVQEISKKKQFVGDVKLVISYNDERDHIPVCSDDECYIMSGGTTHEKL